MHSVLARYLKLEKELKELANNLSRNKGMTDRETELLEEALGCPFCANEQSENQQSYRLARRYIPFVLKKNGFEVSAVVDQLNKLCQGRHHDNEVVAVVDGDGNIDFVNTCTNGIYDVLRAAAELIQ